MPIAWDDSLSVGIPEIDLEHRTLMSIIHQLHETIKTDGLAADQLAIIDKLLVAAQRHFLTEDRWFQIHGFPEADHHNQQHQEFYKRVTEFRDMIELGTFDVGLKINLFVSEWLETHLRDEDQKYKRYLAELGVITS